MTTIAFPKEIFTGEKRCALLPSNVKAYKLLGAEVIVESGLGSTLHIDDEQYVNAGAQVVGQRKTCLNEQILYCLFTNYLNKNSPYYLTK